MKEKLPINPAILTWARESANLLAEDVALKMKKPLEVVEAWEKEKVKVIIFIFGRGWVPYPDDLLWDGFQDQEGVASYVEEKYELKHIVTASDVPYIYEIWVRK